DRDPGDGDAELVLGSPGDGVGQLLVGCWVAAEGVGPDAGPGALGEGAARDEDATRAVDHVAGEGEVQRGVGVMHLALVRGADGGACVVEQDDPLAHRGWVDRTHMSLPARYLLGMRGT